MPIFAIRDDDINAFTSVDTLKRVYDKDLAFLKPSLCLTPRAGDIYRQILVNELSLPTKQEKLAFAARHAAKIETYDWRTRADLIAQLRSMLAIGAEVVLHGVTHNPGAAGFECECSPPLVSDFIAIRSELESVLQTRVRMFSPPNNSINGDWLKLLNAAGLDLVTSVGVRPSECGWPVDSLVSMAQILPVHLTSKGQDRAWRICRYRKVRTLQSYPISIFSKEADVIAALRSAFRRSKHFTLAIHSYQFDQPDWLYDLFKAVCHEAHHLGYEFGTLSSIAEKSAHAEMAFR